MNKKFYLTPLLLSILFVTSAFCLPADVEEICADKYLPRLMQELKAAQSSINVVMFYSDFDPEKNSASKRIANELVNAHNRGVKVTVILDRNIPFSEFKKKGVEWQAEGKNKALFKYLQNSGIEVYYDNKISLTHAKVIVIDEQKVIIGSTNWSRAALYTNYEASVLITSPAFAKEVLTSFLKITIDYKASEKQEDAASSIRVPKILLEDASLAPTMVTTQEERTIDLYLYLLKQAKETQSSTIELDYDKIAPALGLDVNRNRKQYVRILSNLTRRLDRKYSLIKRKKRPKKGPIVTLLDFPAKTPYTFPIEGKYFLIPQDYWSYGWNKTLSIPAKYCYLINLYKTADTNQDWWEDYIPGIYTDFNVSESTIAKGMKRLRDFNIMDIAYTDYPEEGGYSGRAPARYTLLGFYSPKGLQVQIVGLESSYGKEAVQKARDYAKIVFKANNIRVIQDIIKKEMQYGSEWVAEAFSIVAKKAPDNPKRSYEYVVGTLQIMEEERSSE